ncbi:hypothetical protein P7C73_g4615, partial [Tremellales sp. Uapishka_1]
MSVLPSAVPFTYDEVNHIDLDAYIPSKVSISKLPVIVIFHGGGMVAGSKKDALLPVWILEKVIPRDVLVISANYRLLYPSTTSDMIADAHSLFAYLSSPASGLAQMLGSRSLSLDLDNVAVVGVSGGNYVARAAATLSSIVPRPKAWLGVYGMGNDFFLDHWVTEKETYPLALKIVQERLDDLLTNHGGKLSSEAPLFPDPALKGITDAENRVGLFVQMHHDGTLDDYIFDTPGLSEALRALPYDERLAAVPKDKAHLRLPITEHTSPAFFIHGTKDITVPIVESQNALGELEKRGIKHGHAWVEGADHGLLDPSFIGPGPPARMKGWEDAADKGIEWIMESFKA